MDDSLPTPADPSQFLRMFVAHESELRAYVGALIRDAAAREDVFQEIALTLWQTFGKYDAARPFGAWARGVATNKILQEKRRNAKLPLAFSPEAIQAVQDAWDRAQADAGEDRRKREAAALEECVRQLPDRSARIVALHYAERVPAVAIAARMGATADAVYQTLSRVRGQLAECIRRRLKQSAD